MNSCYLRSQLIEYPMVEQCNKWNFIIVVIDILGKIINSQDRMMDEKNNTNKDSLKLKPWSTKSSIFIIFWLKSYILATIPYYSECQKNRKCLPPLTVIRDHIGTNKNFQ